MVDDVRGTLTIIIPYSHNRMTIGASLLLFGAFLAAALSAYFALANRKLEKLHGRSRVAEARVGGWVPRKRLVASDSTGASQSEYDSSNPEDDVLDLELLSGLSSGIHSKDFRYVP